MRSSKTGCILFLSVVMSGAIPAVFAASPPASLNFPANGQFRLDISNTNPNLIVVPDDRIIAINSAAGMLTDKRNTKDGALIFATTTEKPFTLFIETERGQAFSVHASPKAVAGKSYRLQAMMPVHRDTAKSWEQSQPYEALLVSLGKSFLQGRVPEGYTSVPVLNQSIKVSRGLSASAQKSWAGGNLSVTRYQLINSSSTSLPLQEKAFWVQGIRSIMFAYPTDKLAAGGAIDMFVIRDIQGAW
ncbi:type-F conjugative transfer system secretin TraK [Budviciaceae bacterium BWR-B9]|uniref:Type-F conjugative transfer system secretin TraK n=1 Tax=Limnobaculum allomyrinae TaxID=2791986 RepID=A0ABS1IUW0_9GAMM|nr:MULTISPECIES: type-F conjugative transfer system secretin TraK [Limnobaculum]MBK5145550.1 type-F conjugative transfer system secretin TraK [Limnobaculum allomyrinae]MBV7693668.1 type-F conjugative transfer system secretin TraK [Limnobaculum sp. M2-1]